MTTNKRTVRKNLTVPSQLQKNNVGVSKKKLFVVYTGVKELCSMKKEHHASVLFKIGGNTLSWMSRLEVYGVKRKKEQKFIDLAKKYYKRSMQDENI
ncbi:hypothetical protein BK720_25435 [Bacillus thuringiensis serovar brasilensis]|uniref:hypothetical protein n=1 Tax=Bacillus cereus group TaxID=86661 RepID=UPI000A376B39|nr:hypothetical protein [Bacillus thuringiensis]MCU5032127.1 hypothetical protein [Bacillus cereus]MRA70022.1 hypothetical protein [Bacillus thuringiensis]MRA88504.1 hypothetical protein [Bacillus thuringiensis]MRC51774.1 hypothetical protein [Bacillus thuringiensis]OTX26878.1 hypothetical protein BK720_25435 [Bacillus thuringiensis serovar brasilensis]